MSTRSLIAEKDANGTIRSVYCHYDGYPDHTGRILKEFYDTPEKLTELINLGDFRQLKENIEDIESFTSLGEPWEFNSPDMSYTLQEFIKTGKSRGADYLYLFDEGSWKIISAYN